MNAKFKDIIDNVKHKEEVAHTISKKFKLDLLERYSGEYNNEVAYELGCARGYTTYILSFIFKKVYAIDNNNDNIDIATQTCINRDNVEFINMNLYAPWPESFNNADFVFIDAVHEYNTVLSDINNCIIHFGNPLLVFDDYGLPSSDVKSAIDYMIMTDKLEIKEYIGNSPETMKHPRNIKYFDYEGVVCQIKNGAELKLIEE